MKRCSRQALKGILISLLTLIVGFFSCQKESPFTPAPQSKTERSASQLKFLKPLHPRFNKSFTMQQLITAANGGFMEVGDDTAGYSSLNFLPGDLSQDTQITFSWDSQGYITDLGPHGLVFNNPVDVVLSYRDADLTGINEDSLKIWYYNDVTNSYELIGGTVNKTDKVIEGFINHFSRYVIAGE